MKTNEAAKIATEALTEEEKRKMTGIFKEIGELSHRRIREKVYGQSYVTERMAKKLRDDGYGVAYGYGNCTITW